MTILFVAATLRNGRLFGDESAYRFQARLYAAGQAQAEPMPGATYNAAAVPVEIFYEHTIQTPRAWFSKYPPGWPMVLAIGYVLHIPWLVNPLLAIVQLILIWYLARPFGTLCQALAVSFAASSVYFMMWSVGYMSHACEAVVALLALAAVLKSVEERRIRWLVVAFALVFFSTQVRPYTGAVIGGVCTLIALAGFRRQRRLAIQAIGVIALSAAASAAAVLFLNRYYTGDMFLSPYAMITGGRAVEEITISPSGILFNLKNITRWEVVSTIRCTFPFMFLLAIYALAREKEHRFEVVSLALLFPALVAAHVIKAEPSGSFNGNRFYFEGFGAIAIVCAHGCQLLMKRWQVRQTVFATVLIAMLALQAANCVGGMYEVDVLSRPYVLMHDLALRQTVPLVFLHDGPAFTAKHTNWNDIHWRSARTVYLVDPGPDRRDQAACRFGRPKWTVLTYHPDTKTGSVLNGTSVCAAAP